ncbi:alpha/beta fold hydrolase [Nocardia sp. CC227C]|uniref:alpha/beta fold hydrolase n=1 Tax=Nocardia sp. CC227C TaxID=3044562 RepID=UPI00278C3040|nr:alpha/beta hydrolase [Nocardia sp. CC227C]
MPAVYKSQRDRTAIAQWCSKVLAGADFPLSTTTIDSSTGRIHLTSAGVGPPRIVVLPGTGFNAATTLPWLRALSSRWPTTVVDLPGQPGLSDPNRPRRARLPWYGRVVDEVLSSTEMDSVVLVGNSLGAAVALAAGSPRIAGRVLVSPAGFIRLRVDPRVALASALWLLRPSAAHTRDILRWLVAPGAEPPETEVEWMTLLATGCRTTLAPPPLPADLLARRAESPCAVGVGMHDRFLPPRQLAAAVRSTMGAELRIFSGMGHLTTPAHVTEVVDLVAEVAGPGEG